MIWHTEKEKNLRVYAYWISINANHQLWLHTRWVDLQIARIQFVSRSTKE